MRPRVARFDTGVSSRGPWRARAAHSESSASQVENVAANSEKLFFSPRTFTFNALSKATFLKNVLAGLTVSLAMVPEAVAFAFVVGVSPLTGLWTTVLLGFFAAAFGGRPGIMSSASGACAVVMADLVRSHGPVYLSAAVVVAGALQVLAGALKLGRFIRLVPAPCMLGFVNGLAVLMFAAQMQHFRSPLTGLWLSGAPLAATAGLAAFTSLLVQVVPRLTTAVPGSLVAVGLATALMHGLGLPAATLADLAGAETFKGGLSVLPALGVPAVPWLSPETWATILPYAVTMAAVGLIEALLTLNLIDGMVDDGTRGSTKKECFGQGIGNVANGLAGGMGGCALIGQSLVNVNAGGTSRVSGISMSLFLALGIVGGAGLLGKVPVASLVGVMLVVCYKTFAWSSLRLVRRVPRIDVFTIALVSAVVVLKDLATAVFAGTVVSALSFAYKQAKQISATAALQDDGWKAYRLRGPLFFGSASAFADLFTPAEDPQDVVLDFGASRVYDQSGLDAIDTICEKYGAQGKTVHLRHLSPDCASLLTRKWRGRTPPYRVIEVDSASDPIYEVAEDYSDAERFGDRAAYDMPIPRPPESPEGA